MLAPLLSAAALKKRYETTNLQIVDASWFLPGSDDPYSGRCIKDAVEFDFGFVKAADADDQTPHLFARAFARANLNPTHPTVFYDRAGLFSAPRAWWMARQAGFSTIAILDGGLPAWIAAGHETSTTYALLPDDRFVDFMENMALQTPSYGVNCVTADTVKSVINTDVQIVDARPKARFDGSTPEPRAGMRSGHIPSALSLPFGNLKTANNHLLPLPEIAQIIGAAGIDMSRPIITSCGSGVTAAGLTFIFHLLGKDDVSLYSGSWAQWGAGDSGLPIEL